MIFVDMFSPMFFVVVAGAYLLGAVPFALLISRLMRLPDPRSYGSGNVGATNVARSGSKAAAILTLLADGGKGAAAVAAAAVLPAAVPAAGFMAVLGHATSPFLKFRGGRGVATALAVYLCWQPALGAAVLALWGLVFAVCRYSSVASLVATTVATGLYFLFASPPLFVAAAAINMLVVVRHRDNLRRLLSGSEQGFGR